MNRIAIFKTMPVVTFKEVASEIKWRYPDLNYKTGASEFIKLMVVVNQHAKTQQSKDKTVAKIMLANLITETFRIDRAN